MIYVVYNKPYKLLIQWFIKFIFLLIKWCAHLTCEPFNELDASILTASSVLSIPIPIWIEFLFHTFFSPFFLSTSSPHYIYLPLKKFGLVFFFLFLKYTPPFYKTLFRGSFSSARFSSSSLRDFTHARFSQKETK